MDTRKKEIIATLIKAERPDLANAVAKMVVTAAPPLIDITVKAVRDQFRGSLPTEGKKLRAVFSVLKKYFGYDEDDAYDAVKVLLPNMDELAFEGEYNRIPVSKYKMSKTFEVVTPESAEVGDFEETGYEYEDQKFDSLVEIATEIIRGGGHEPSSSSPHKGMWWTSEGEPDYQTGASTSYGFHPDGLSDIETKWLFEIIKRGAVR